MASESSRNRQVRIPPQVQRQMQKQMERNLSPSMQKYVGPYMQQNVIDPGLRGVSNGPMAANNTMTQTHHVVSRPQSIVFEPTNKPVTPQQSALPTTNETTEAQAPSQPYEFIINPGEEPKKPLLPGSGSIIVRIGIVLGGLLVLLVLFAIIKGLLSPDSNMPSLLQLTQDQQGIIYVTKGAASENSLSDSNSNFAATASLSLTSSQSKLINYMAINGKKINAKELALGIDPQISQQLAASTATNTYNPTFNQVMKTSLKSYMSDLKIAYSKTTGKKGRALLQDNYQQANLLLIQLGN